MSDIRAELKDFALSFNEELKQYFPMPQRPEKRVVEAMEYSVLNGGKRIRPFLVKETANLFDVPLNQSIRVGAALEMLHVYSLIHDDLPAMDNDDLRRGKPTCHKQFDEATAILAGDALLTYAFEIMSHKNTHPDAKIRCQLVQLLAQAAGGFRGMVAGQMLDLLAENMSAPQNSEDLIYSIEEMKTGRLLRFAIEAGAVLGGADLASHNALMLYARKIGLTFQISDDILDVEGDQALVGKTLHKDEAQNKLTFVSLYGLQGAKDLARKLTDEAIEALSVFGDKAEKLVNLAEFIINRNK